MSSQSGSDSDPREEKALQTQEKGLFSRTVSPHGVRAAGQAQGQPLTGTRAWFTWFNCVRASNLSTAFGGRSCHEPSQPVLLYPKDV